MPLYTSSYLKQRSANKSSSIREKLISESRKTHHSFDIFLSHSFLDKDEVEGIYIELTEAGFSVYVDWIVDPHLDRNNVTKETAEIIRGRLKTSKTLLLAISANAQMSKWMPWELGYVDGHTNQCAIFPVSRETTAPNNFRRVEYLLLYPYIKKVDFNKYNFETYVTESAHTYVSLNNWVVSRKQPSYNFQNIDLL